MPAGGLSLSQTPSHLSRPARIADPVVEAVQRQQGDNAVRTLLVLQRRPLRRTLSDIGAPERGRIEHRRRLTL
jgi:hypothetical protein